MCLPATAAPAYLLLRLRQRNDWNKSQIMGQLIRRVDNHAGQAKRERERERADFALFQTT